MSPLREAAKKASASSSPRCFSTLKRGLDSRTWVRARAASCRQAAGSRSMVAATSSNSSPNTSCSRKAARSSGESRSSASISGRVTSSSSSRLPQGIGKPGTDISLALVTRRLELIEAEPRDRTAQERLGFAHLAAVGPHPADEGLLHDVLGVSHRAEHAIGDAHELGTQRIETRRCVLMADACHQATARTAAFAAAGSSQTPKPTARRFQPLMILITSVSFTCSSSVNSAFRAS